MYQAVHTKQLKPENLFSILHSHLTHPQKTDLFGYRDFHQADSNSNEQTTVKENSQMTYKEWRATLGETQAMGKGARHKERFGAIVTKTLVI